MRTFATIDSYQRRRVLEKRDHIREKLPTCYLSDRIRWERLYAAQAILSYYIADWLYPEFRTATLSSMRRYIRELEANNASH